MLATMGMVTEAANPQVGELLGRWGRGPSYVVEMDGDLAFIGSGSNVLIAEVTDLEDLQIIGEVVLPGVVFGLSLEGGLLAVASGGGGHFINVSDPFQPAYLGFIEPPAFKRYSGVLLREGIAHFVGWQVFSIVDCRDPSDPVLVGGLGGIGSDRIVLDDNAYAYVPNPFSGIATIDVINPAFPTKVGVYPSSAEAAIALDDSYLYSAGGQGFSVIDYSVPAVLEQVGFLDMADVGSGMDIHGDRAYVAAGDDGFTVIDVSNPVAPVVSGSLASAGEGGYTIAVSGQKAVASDFDVIRVLDLTQPDIPIETDRLSMPGYSWSAAISGDLVLVGDYLQGLRVLDFSNPEEPFEVGFVGIQRYVVDVAVGGHLAVMANGVDGITIVDFAEPSAPQVIGALDTPGRAQKVAVSGGLALVADMDGGLRVIDISVPELPIEIGIYDPETDVVDVAVSGSFVFLAVTGVGIQSIDLSDSGNPVPASVIFPGASPQAIDVDGDLLVSAQDHDTGMLAVIDISEPWAMTPLGTWNSPISWDGGRMVGIGDGMAYLIGSGDTAHVFDLADPADPVEVLEIPGIRQRMDVYVSGRRVVFAEIDAGIALHFNISRRLFFDDFETGDMAAWSEVVQ